MNPYTFADLTPINDCPFCRSDEVALNDGYNGLRNGRPAMYYWVQCTNCSSDGPDYNDRQAAIENWNVVTDELDALQKDCDRLRRELDDCNGVIR